VKLHIIHPPAIAVPPCEATVYTQVIESLQVLKLPHPNPPLIKGRELDFLVSPQYIGGIKGGNSTYVYTVASCEGGTDYVHLHTELV
jgi:hypothetical protein